MTTIHVGGAAPYDVVVGRGLLSALPALLAGVARVAVVSSKTQPDLAARVADNVRGAGVDVLPITVPDGEAAKQVKVAARCWNALAAGGFTRTDAVVGVGGGAVTDLAGWVAACWLRGVRVVQVPTTLLGMVDAAIGGKTGVNIAAGKNLVGAFHPPAGVLCDLDLLATLPPRDFVAGLAEVVKAGFIADPAILDLIEREPAAAADPRSTVVAELVKRAVGVKADAVSQDLREAGPREMLNYGHTLAHAIEHHERYRWRHGDAVAVGMVFAASLGRRSGRLDDSTAARHRAVLQLVGLPTGYDAGAWPSLLDSMRLDKKARGHRLRFVVLDGLARPGILDDPDDGLLEAAYQEVCT